MTCIMYLLFGTIPVEFEGDSFHLSPANSAGEKTDTKVVVLAATGTFF